MDKKKALKLAIGGAILQPAGRKLGEFKSISLSKRPDVIYPSTHLSVEEAPGLKGLETGDEVTLVIRGEVKSHNVSDSADHKHEDFRIELHHIGVINPKGANTTS